ncbi:hypothetical protein FOZ60_001436 [Perkinsus olseni]|uniref:Carboxypeptidase n=1 Tax=Perkinsus olseni TaxID=32597 RepID=A0A7J6PLD3_PEROL|nr:hypothetical protein FOZ60_001436 [Perkinsus olseni]
MTGVFLEIGPCILNDNGTGTDLNPYSWNARSNLLFVDQPTGAGFSEGPFVTNGTFEATDDLYTALQEFFQKHTQYKGKDFYVGGESYGGHFVPAIAQKIHRENIKGAEPRIEIRGIAIGNGYMNPAIQVLSYPEMAYQSGTAPDVITYAEYLTLEREMVACSRNVTRCLAGDSRHGDGAVPFDTSQGFAFPALRFTNSQTSGWVVEAIPPTSNAPIASVSLFADSTCEDANFCRFMGAVVPLRRRGISMFDMRITQKLSGPGPAIPCTLPGRDDALDRYLNQKEVQRKLGVNKRFQSGSPAGDFGRDALFPFETLLPELLEAEIRVLLFDGDQDFVCNWIGFERVANEIDWPGRAAFVRAPRQEYEGDDGISIGQLRVVGYKDKGMLRFLQVYRTGHFAAVGQPAAAQLIINDFISGVLGPVSSTAASEDEDVNE